MALAFAITNEGGVGQARLLLVERHDHGADLLNEPVQLCEHGRMLAGAHHDVRLEQADGRDPADRVRFERSDDALALRLVLEPCEHGRGVDHHVPFSP